jgi:peroxiredoxin
MLSFAKYTVADPYSQCNWAKGMNNDFEQILFWADDDASWAKAHKLDKDYSGASLGTRAERFSMIVEDGVVKTFQIVEDAKNDAQTVFDQA